MNYKEHTYTYSASWAIFKKEKSGDEYIDVLVNSGGGSETKDIAHSEPFIKILPETNWFSRSKATVQTANGKVYSDTVNSDSNISFEHDQHEGSELSRTSICSTAGGRLA